MRGEMLMNRLWYEELTPEALFMKIFEKSDFSEEEIRKMVMLLGLTEDETARIFYG